MIAHVSLEVGMIEKENNCYNQILFLGNILVVYFIENHSVI